MNRVLDSSVAFKWVVPEVYSDKAIRLRDDARIGNVHLLAPVIFYAELGHALTRAERQGRVSAADGWSLWLDVMTDAPQFFPMLPLLPRAYELSSQFWIGIYDCLYVALAETESCELITADMRLVSNLKPHFPFIVDVATLP